jgi:hypothetical protein
MPTSGRIFVGVLAIAFAGGIIAVTTFAIEKALTAFASRGHPAHIQARAAIERRERDAAASAARSDQR